MAEMGIYEAMKTLKAVRKLRPDPIPDEVLRRVLEAATWAPTGGNRQPWRIVLVKDHTKKQRLGELYSRSWKAYVGHYSSAIPESMPAAARERTIRTLKAGDYLADHFGDTPAVAVFCFNPITWLLQTHSKSALPWSGVDRSTRR